MTVDAVTLIQQMRSEIARMGAENAYQYMPRDTVLRFGERLEAFEPFKTIAESWLLAPLGGGRTGQGTSGRWVWHQLLSGGDPEVVIASVSEFVTNNRYDALEVRVVKGISVPQSYPLTATATLVPNDTLPKEWPHNRAFGNDMLGEHFPTNTAALVQEFVVEPALLSRPEDQQEGDFGERQRVRDAYAARLRLALGLASGGPVEMPLVYAQIDRGLIIHDAGSALLHRPTTTHFGNDFQVDVAVALELNAQLEHMQSPRALELSIDRLLRSRAGRSLEDRIIDLGMGAEIALMHNPKAKGNGKSEITNKVASRGAWLLADTVEERVAISRMLEDLYSARSNVVHNGEASGKLQSRIAEFDALVARIARALLTRGSFPDWKSLVLGDDGRRG